MDSVRDLELVGGRLCLDFANTVPNYLAAAREDHLVDYAALLAWARHAGALDDVEVRQLTRVAAKRPGDAEAMLVHARVLREAIFETFYAVAAGKRPPASAIATVNVQLTTALGNQQLVRDGEAWVLRHVAASGELEAPLWPVTRSAVQLLTETAEHGRIRVCGGAEHDCSWLFIDQSKGGRRRWCTMRDCGNRAKARRHYERTRHA